MTYQLRPTFGADHPIVAMVHLPGLPGRPRHDRHSSLESIAESVGRDLDALQEAGVDGLLFCNEADLPYQLEVRVEASAAMAALIGALRRRIRVPFGIDLVWDPLATLAVARATGAAFVREVFTGVYESDLGVMRPDLAAVGAFRAQIGANSVALFSNITPEFASSLGHRDIAERARSAVYLGIEALLVSGPITGTPVDLEQLRSTKAAVPATPVLSNTGATAETIGDLLDLADGAIVGTSLKYEGVTWNPVDPARARTFMDAVRRKRRLLGDV